MMKLVLFQLERSFQIPVENCQHFITLRKGVIAFPFSSLRRSLEARIWFFVSTREPSA